METKITFKTSEEIHVNLNEANKNKLWLSKEEYKKRVEEFRKQIFQPESEAHSRWINGLINKILLGKK